jgi:hypothetical protein
MTVKPIVPAKSELNSTHHRSDSELKCEPGVADELEVKEGFMRIRAFLVQRP